MLIKCLKNFNSWSVFELLDPDPGEPIIYGSDWIRIRTRNTALYQYELRHRTKSVHPKFFPNVIISFHLTWRLFWHFPSIIGIALTVSTCASLPEHQWCGQPRPVYEWQYRWEGCWTRMQKFPRVGSLHQQKWVSEVQVLPDRTNNTLSRQSCRNQCSGSETPNYRSVFFIQILPFNYSFRL